MSARIVAILADGEITAHAGGALFNYSTLCGLDDEALLEPLVPVVRVERPRYAIRGRVRVLPRRVAHISQSLLDLSVDDE